MFKQSMKKTKRLKLFSGVLLFLMGVFTVLPCRGAGLMKPVDGSDGDVYLKSHHVSVTINNGFARTEVDQVFANDGESDLEAIYSFPLPKQASLSELSLWIDGQEVIGEVLEKERARKVYEEQVRKGNDAALAEKDDFKTFDVVVYPVRAHDQTRVRLVYYQPIEIDSNVGRYLYPLAEGGVDEERIAFWSVDDKVSESFKFNLILKSAFAIQDVRLPMHQEKAIITKLESIDSEEGASGSGDVYQITLEATEGASLSEDIILYYKLDDSIPARLELIPYREDPASTGSFMVVVTPAASLERISEGTDWTFVLDVSGSMSGAKISTLADGVAKTIGTMSMQDRFNIITFNNSAHDFTGGFVQATPENVQRVIAQVKGLQSGGGTNLYAGLKKAYDSLDDDRTTGIILVTDGVANIGNTQHAQFVKLLKQYDIRLFPFVIGNSANQPLMDRLAIESGGFAMNVCACDDVIGRILQAKNHILFENMRDVELKFKGERVMDLTPNKVGSLYQGQQLVMFGHYQESGDVEVGLKANIGGQEQSWTCHAFFPETDRDHPEIERLWALSSIEEIMQQIRDTGETERLRKEIVALGTEYSLVTDYTSMVVLSEEEMENEQIQRKNSDRVNKERQAQKKRQNAPVRNFRQDQRKQNPSGNNGMFNGRRSPGVGSGPVGPIFLAVVMWLRRRKRSEERVR